MAYWLWMMASAWAGAPGAFAVVLGAAAPPEATDVTFQAAMDVGLPAYLDYPKTGNGADFGLGEGKVVIVAVTEQEEAATKLARSLLARGLPAQVVATTEEVLPTRVLAIDRIEALGNGAPLYVYNVCLGGEVPVDCLSNGRPEAKQRFVLPFVAPTDGTSLFLHVDAGEPWVCTPVPLGPWRDEFAVWLKAPLQVGCFESTAPVKRKRDR